LVVVAVVEDVDEDVVAGIAWNVQRNPWGKEELTSVVAAADLVTALAFDAGVLEWPVGMGCQLLRRWERPDHGSSC